jgi:hypothetical protein
LCEGQLLKSHLKRGFALQPISLVAFEGFSTKSRAQLIAPTSTLFLVLKMSVNLFCLFALLPIIIVDAKIHSMQRFRRDSNTLDVNKSFVAHDMPQPIGFGDLSKVFMVSYLREE